MPAIAGLGLSPLIVGIVAGALYGNALRDGMPASWAAGVNFSARKLLRIAVAFFGLRVSLQEIAQVGLPGLAESVLIVVSTLVIGTWAGMKLMKLDRDTALLTAAGSAICGAAAVLAFESTLQSKPHKSAMAVGSVVLFGTLSMFLYPVLFKAGWLHLDTVGAGLFFGGTIHEVAQVVGAASNVSPEAEHIATIVKMTRVMLLVPVLLVIGMWINRTPRGCGSGFATRRRAKRRPARAAQAGDSLVRARLPRLRGGELAARVARSGHANAQHARHLRADHGHDRARHRNPHLADPRGRSAGTDHRVDPVCVADWRRSGHHLGRAASVRLIPAAGSRPLATSPAVCGALRISAHNAARPHGILTVQAV